MQYEIYIHMKCSRPIAHVPGSHIKNPIDPSSTVTQQLHEAADSPLPSYMFHPLHLHDIHATIQVSRIMTRKPRCSSILYSSI